MPSTLHEHREPLLDAVDAADGDKYELEEPRRQPPQLSPPSPRSRFSVPKKVLAVAAVLVILMSLQGVYFFHTRGANSPPSEQQHGSYANHPHTDHATCGSVPQSILDELHAADTKRIAVVSNSQLVSEMATIQAPAKVCFFVSIPQVEDDMPFPAYHDTPVAGKGPDIIHLLVNSSDVTLTFPPLLPLPGQDIIENPPHSIIYFAAADMFTEGDYTVWADQEYSHWKWAQEWTVQAVNREFVIDGITDVQELFRTHWYDPHPLQQTHFHVSGTHEIPHLPLCNASVNAGHGRWYVQDKFPALAEDHVDETGFTWQGDHCHLAHYRPEDMLDCFAGKTIHVYGDSMTRRFTKSFINGGNWCNTPGDLRGKCQDADDVAGVPLSKLDVDESGQLVYTDIKTKDHFNHEEVTTIHFGKNTTVHFWFLTTITKSTSSWMQRFYDSDDLIKDVDPVDFEAPLPDYEIRPGAKPRSPTDIPKADVVMIGFGAWDQAFMGSFDAYEHRLNQFHTTLVGAYPDIPIILRLANSWCCRTSTNGFRRYNGGRVQELDDRTRRIFGIDAGGITADGRIRTIDPVMMNGRPDIIFDYGRSDANHPRASHVRVELQMMLNSYCPSR